MIEWIDFRIRPSHNESAPHNHEPTGMIDVNVNLEGRKC
jgi:hypothetical protein